MTIHVKVGGAWKEVSKALVKVGGAWKEANALNTKVSGAWKTVPISSVLALVSTNRVLLLDANAYSGSGNWLDTSGSNNHGTLTGGAFYVASRDRDYFSINERTRDGGDEYIALTSGVVNPNNSFTIGFWVRLNTKQPHITNKVDTLLSNLSADSGLQLRYNETATDGFEIGKSFQSSSLWNVFTNTTVGLNEIYNVVYVRDNSTNPDTFKLYINGVQLNPDDGTTIGTHTDNESGLVAPQILGRNYSSTGNDNESLNGRIYHVVAYDAALSSSQILQNYNALKDRYTGDAACPLNLENLEVYLNTGIAASLTGTNNTNLAQGTTWSDLSGQDNHFGFGTNSSTTTTPKYSTDSGSYTITRPTTITSDITAAVYLASHADLMNVFGTNIASAKTHWTNNGYNEGRHISFDVHAYLEHNNDLLTYANPAFYTDHEETALHFVTNRTTEDRAVYPKDAIKTSLMGFGHLDINGDAGHARSALNADFYKFGTSSSGDDFSIGVWFYIDSWNAFGGIFSCGKESHAGSFELVTGYSFQKNVQLKYHLAFGTSNYPTFTPLTSAGTLDEDNWHYCVVTLDRSTGMTMYIDGIQSATTTSTLYRNYAWGTLGTGGATGSGNGYGSAVSATDVDNVFRIGTNRDEDDHFNGRIGQFHLWKGKALSKREVLAAYNGTKHKYGHPDNLYRDG